MIGIRLSTVVTVVAALSTGLLLFGTSQKVQKAERRLAALEKQKEETEEAIRVLHAEWDYLNRPDRLEAMAARYLGMKQPDLAAVSSDPEGLPVAGAADVPDLQPALLRTSAGGSGAGKAGR